MRTLPSSSLLPEVQKGKIVRISVDGNPVEANEGETIATALLSVGIKTFRLSSIRKEPRGFFCGMGICFECLVIIDGGHPVRACATMVTDGMRVETCKDMT